MKSFIATVADGVPLSRAEARGAFDIIMSGGATPTQIAGFLMALRVRGETVDEITGAVAAMRAKMVRIEAPAGAIDIVGTGGDQSGTYNISTASAIVAAAAGAIVAKHGNRAASSKSGAADTLEALGVSLSGGPEVTQACIEKANVGFMFAPTHHTAMKYVQPIRADMGTRTIFNLVGPLANPAGVKRQVIGVFDPKWAEPLAHVLRGLGSDHVWVLHGDGMDELTVTKETQVFELKDGSVNSFTVTPEDAGLSRHPMASLKGGEAHENARAMLAVLDGETGGHRDMVLLNTAAALIVAGLATSLKQGAEMAAAAIDDGRAKATLTTLIEVSGGAA